jgi:hypothetical protein
VVKHTYNTGMDILATLSQDTLPASLGHLKRTVPQCQVLGMVDDTPFECTLKGCDRPAVAVQVSVGKNFNHGMSPYQLD